MPVKTIVLRYASDNLISSIRKAIRSHHGAREDSVSAAPNGDVLVGFSDDDIIKELTTSARLEILMKHSDIRGDAVEFDVEVSKNGEEDFTAVGVAKIPGSDETHAFYGSDPTLVAEVRPHHAHSLLAGSYYVRSSRDGGKTWDNVTTFEDKAPSDARERAEGHARKFIGLVG